MGGTEYSMTNKSIFDEVFPLDRQEGGSHYKEFKIQPYEFTRTNKLSFFQGNVVKYVCRYLNKNGIEDLKKIIHYCQMEIELMKKEKNVVSNKRNNEK